MNDLEFTEKKNVLLARLRELQKEFDAGKKADIMRNVREQFAVLKELRELDATELEILWAIDDTPRA